jgi:Na+-driven multidrug efflux pump
MAQGWQEFREEFRPMIRLAWPLALAELGWMAQGLVDLVMAGPLGPAAIGAGSLANMLFYPIAISGTGLLLGMDTLVAQSFGAADPRDCRRTLVNGCWLALALTPPLTLAIGAMIPLMRALGTNPRVLALFGAYLGALIASLSASGQRSQAGHLLPRERQSGQCRRQLRSHVRALGRTRHGLGRFGLVDRHRAIVHGRGLAGGAGLA